MLARRSQWMEMSFINSTKTRYLIISQRTVICTREIITLLRETRHEQRKSEPTLVSQSLGVQLAILPDWPAKSRQSPENSNGFYLVFIFFNAGPQTVLCLSLPRKGVCTHSQLSRLPYRNQQCGAWVELCGWSACIVLVKPWVWSPA